MATSLIAVVFTVPIVILAVRFTSRSTRWLERSVFVMFSLPHITVALAVVFFAVRYLGPFYQSLALLVVVCVAGIISYGLQRQRWGHWYGLVEKHAFVFTILVVLSILVGGVVEIIPTIIMTEQVPAVITEEMMITT